MARKKIRIYTVFPPEPITEGDPVETTCRLQAGLPLLCGLTMQPLPHPSEKAIRQAIRLLTACPPLCRKIFIRYYIERKTSGEIAFELQLTEHKVRNLLGKTGRLLRHRAGPDDHDAKNQEQGTQHLPRVQPETKRTETKSIAIKKDR